MSKICQMCNCDPRFFDVHCELVHEFGKDKHWDCKYVRKEKIVSEA